LLDTAFKQQRLKAWQPLLTPKTVLPTLFAAGIVFAPLGGLFLYGSDTVSSWGYYKVERKLMMMCIGERDHH
jgi:hypothetical protein